MVAKRGKPRWIRSALLAAAFALGVTGGRADDTVQRGASDDGGVSVRWVLKAGTSGLGHLEVQIADARSGQPYDLRAGDLKAWLQHGRRALSDAEMPCVAKAVALNRRPIGGRAGIDLNTPRLVTLNTNGSITILNPALGARTSRLEAVIDLPNRPLDWVRGASGTEVWVLLEHGRLALVDLAARRVTRLRDLPDGTEGRDLAFDATRHILWITLPSRDAVASLDVAVPGAAIVVEPGATPLGLVPAAPEGGANLAMGPPPSAVVVFAAPDAVTWRDGPAAGSTWHIGARPVAAAYSALSRRLIVAGADGTVAALDPADPGAPAQRLRLDHSVSAMRLIDGDRRAFVLGGGRASVVDLATTQQTLRIAAPPEAATLLATNSFLYALDGSGDAATLWSLAGLAAGRDERTEVSLGTFARAAAPGDAPSGLVMAVATAGGAGVVAAHPGSDLLSTYTEGGMQPVDATSNVRRAPIGLKLLDPSLRSTEPGRYEADLEAPRGGAYELVLSSGSPAFAVCAAVDWPAMAEEAAATAPQPRAVLLGVEPAAEGAQRIRLHVALRPDGAALAGVPDMSLLVFDRLTAWQTRLILSETGSGNYEVLVRVPVPGRYMLHAFSRLNGLTETAGALGEVSLGAVP